MHNSSQSNQPNQTPSNGAEDKVVRQIMKIIGKRSFCTIATSSAAQNSHSAGVTYAHADGALWVHTMQSSRKARNVIAHERIGVCIPFRRLPMGPPYTIHFQASADIVELDDPVVAPLLASGLLKNVTRHGEMDTAGSCFIRIRPRGTIHSFGPGARIIDLIRDPLNNGARSFAYAEVAQ